MSVSNKKIAFTFAVLLGLVDWTKALVFYVYSLFIKRKVIKKRFFKQILSHMDDTGGSVLPDLGSK
jgi:hypothetical protein